MTTQSSINHRFLEAVESISKDRSAGRITKSFIGQRVGIKQTSNLSRLAKQETGVTRSVTVENCAKLCSEFGISPEWLLLGVGEMKDERRIADPLLKDQVDELSRIVAQLVVKVARLEKAKKPH